jgi:hypothetical protein
MADKVCYKLYTQKRKGDDPYIDQTAGDQRRQLSYLIIFIAGLFFGFIATSISFYLLLVTNAYSIGVWTGSCAHDIAQVLNSTLDQNRYECGINSHEAEAAGCNFDIMASSWYSDECFNQQVLDQMLQEVSFDWVGISFKNSLLKEDLADKEAVCCELSYLPNRELTLAAAYAKPSPRDPTFHHKRISHSLSTVLLVHSGPTRPNGAPGSGT